MPRGGSGQLVSWGPNFMEWLHHQQVVVEDWTYAGMYFRGDPKMLLLPGEQWDERGNILRLTATLLYFSFLLFLDFKRICPNNSV